MRSRYSLTSIRPIASTAASATSANKRRWAGRAAVDAASEGWRSPEMGLDRSRPVLRRGIACSADAGPILPGQVVVGRSAHGMDQHVMRLLQFDEGTRVARTRQRPGAQGGARADKRQRSYPRRTTAGHQVGHNTLQGSRGIAVEMAAFSVAWSVRQLRHPRRSTVDVLGKRATISRAKNAYPTRVTIRCIDWQPVYGCNGLTQIRDPQKLHGSHTEVTRKPHGSYTNPPRSSSTGPPRPSGTEALRGVRDAAGTGVISRA